MKSRAKNSFLVNAANVLKHVGLWVTSPNSDIVYYNPNFISVEGGAGDVIYCIHGTADRVYAFKVFAETILEKLPSHISAVHLVAFQERAQGKSIEDFSNQLSARISENGHRSVYLICHSRGGLVGARYAEYLASDSNVNVKGVFTIGTPFGGSPLAMAPVTWLSTSVQQMRPDSEFLQELREKMQINLSRYHFYAADRDFIVPLENAFLPERSEALTILDGHEHLSIMSSSRLIDNIALRLSGKGDISLQTICQELFEFINELKHKRHLWSADSKIELLERLLNKLIKLNDFGRGDDYPEVNTIGDFVESFLADQSANVDPVAILKSSLNMPFSYQGNTSSYSFVKGLMIRYKNVPILSPDLVALNEFIPNQARF